MAIKDQVLLIYNPRAGNGMFKSNLDRIIEKFQRKHLLVVPIRGGRPDLLDSVFKSMDQNDFCKVIAAGGDGTIHQVVNSMMRNDIDLPLGVFPSGTANDFAHYFDLPHDIDSMIDIALGDHFSYVDVGKCNDKYFINVAAMGFLVDVSQKTDPNLKNTLGVLSYYLKGMTEVPKMEPFLVNAISDEYTGSNSIYFMLVMNGRSAGGFRRIAEDAKIDDGLLDVIMFKEMRNMIELPQLFFNVMQGHHVENKNVIFFKTSRLTLTTDGNVGTDLDGEKGSEFPLEISVLPSRLKVCTLRDNMEGKRW
ncbi:MAG: YegS/Rv2252/BmrU family lipid kinase [Anaerovoracaceae bacterium]|jgi:diacylglycerol kinase (ATP)